MARTVNEMQLSHIITSMRARTVDHTLKAGESRTLPSWTAAFVYTPCKLVISQNCTIDIYIRSDVTYPGKHNGPCRQPKRNGRLSLHARPRRPRYTRNGKHPPKRALAPANEAGKHADVGNRLGTPGRQHDGGASAHPGGHFQQRLANDLQRKAALAPGSTQDHIRVHLLTGERLGSRLGVPLLKDADHEENVQRQGEGHADADFQVADNHHGDLLRVGKHGILAQRARAGGGR